MKREISMRGLTLPAILAASAGFGFVAPQKAPDFEKQAELQVGIRVVRPDAKVDHTESFSALKSEGNAKVEADTRSGAIRLITGNLAGASLARASTKADYVTVALRYVTSHQDVFGVRADDLVLNEKAVLLDKDVQFLKFNVLRRGILIQDAVVDFRFKQGKLLQVVNRTYAEAQTDDRPSLAEGLDRAAERAVIADSAKATGERFRVLPIDKGYKLVRVAEFDTVAQDGRHFLIQVASASGKVFEIRPTTFELGGSVKATVYPRWYRETPEIRALGETTLTYAGGTVTTDMDGNYTGAPDGSQPTLDGFTGVRVNSLPTTGTKVSAVGAQIRDHWDVVWQKGNDPLEADQSMAQAMAYYHLNAEINHAKRFITTPWFDQKLTANVNLADTCNAYWDGSTVNFFSAGGGCANTGLISDVMYHEWGHGLDANTGGIDDGAYSEGFGDINSLLMTHSNILGIGFRTPSNDPVRDLEPNKVYPADQGEVHAEGLIIGSTFWDLFKALKESFGEERAGDMLSTYALKSIFTASHYTDVYNAILVIDDDNGDLGDNTPNYCIINKAFAEHGLATADEACNLAMIDTFEVDDQAGNGNGVIEPGESISLWLTARNAATGGLNGLQGTLSLTGVDGVTVTNGALVWRDIPARSNARSTNAATFSVASDVVCGSTIHASVALAADTRTSNVATDLTVGRLAGTAQLFAVTGLPLPIRDNQTTTATVTIAGDQWAADTAIQAAHLKFDLTHTYVGDLTVKLIAPNGTSKDIWKGSGATHDEHFDADVSDALKGLTGLGDWKVTVTDSASQDEGTLDLAALTLTPARFECN